ncbi:MAG: TonB-dependent receptor [Crocinitomicaceae bacterium]|nr:TonB-dependent receptor [Crocinitomicaceae bacterium]
MKKQLCTAVLLFIMLPVLAQQIQENDTVKQVNEVLIVYKAENNTPVTYLNIRQADLKLKSTGQEPSFLLSETPSVTNYSDGGGPQGYSYFRIRGIDQTRINVTLDGVPLNEPEDQGAYFSNYADILNSVSLIHIQRGVGTTKNGVASYGGSVQLYSPILYDTAHSSFGAGYGSFNTMRFFGEYHSGLKNNKALYVRASQVYSDGYKYHAHNNSQSIFLSTGLFKTSSDWKLNILLGQQQNGMAWLGVSDSLIAVDKRTNANAEQEVDRFLQCLAQIQNQWRIKNHFYLNSSLYYTFLDGNYNFDFNNFIGLPSTNELYNYAFRSHFTGLFSNFTYHSKTINWITGIHGNNYSRRHIGSEKSLGELYQNTGTKNELSIYSKAEYKLKKFNFFADIQYRIVNFSYSGLVSMPTQTWQFLNPKAGVHARINEHAGIYYSYGSTGREPTRNDMFGGNDDLLSDSLGNALLFNTKPERVQNHELGFRYQNKKLTTDVNLYFMDFANEIVLNGKFGPNGLALTNNVEQSIRTGIELSLQYEINSFLILNHQSSFNYSNITEQSISFEPILTPPLIINQEIVFKLKNFRFGVMGRYQHKSYIDFANSAMVDSYFLLNLRAHLQLKKFQFAVFLNNLTNAHYYNQGYVDYDGTNKYFVQAPLNFFTSVNFTF